MLALNPVHLFLWPEGAIMHDFLIALVFVSLVTTPAMVALFSSHPEDDEPDAPEPAAAVPSSVAIES